MLLQCIIQAQAEIEGKEEQACIGCRTPKTKDEACNIWARWEHTSFPTGVAVGLDLGIGPISRQPVAEHFQKSAEHLPLRNRGLSPFAVKILPILLATRRSATACAAVQPTAPFFRRR
jgi:hypothetical protein